MTRRVFGVRVRGGEADWGSLRENENRGIGDSEYNHTFKEFDNKRFQRHRKYLEKEELREDNNQQKAF